MGMLLVMFLVDAVAVGICAYILGHYNSNQWRNEDRNFFVALVCGVVALALIVSFSYSLTHISRGTPNETRECNSELYTLRHKIDNNNSGDGVEVILEQTENGEREFAVVELNMHLTETLPIYVLCSKGTNYRSLRRLPILNNK